MHRSTVLPIALVLFTSGCWSDESAITGAVWSDDDAEQAYIEYYYEQQVFALDVHGTRNLRYRLMLQAPDGSARRPLTPTTPGSSGADFYYMRDAGYVLAEISDGTITHWERVSTTDGSARDVFTHDFVQTGTCPVYDVIPSPDGSTLARLTGELGVDVGAGDTPPVPGEANACAGGTFTVGLLDAETGAVEAEYDLDVTGMPDWMWTRSGELHVWDQGDQAWRIDPEAGPVSDPVPDCTWPRTSSSPLSSNGVLIEPGTLDDPIQVVNRPVDNCW